MGGLVAATIAQQKGRSAGAYFALGFFLPLIGILAAGFASPVDASQSPEPAKPVNPLAELTGSGDPKTQSFLLNYQVSLANALTRCEAGELVLAYGAGFWSRSRVVFVLTDQRFIFAEQMGEQMDGATTSVSDLDQFALDEERRELKSPAGVLTVSRRSPFTVSELVDLISQRHEPPRCVEMAGHGKMALSESPTRSSDHGEVADDGRIASSEHAQPSVLATSTASELERLDALRRSGAIDDDEFAELKRQLVWGDNGGIE